MTPSFKEIIPKKYSRIFERLNIFEYFERKFGNEL